MTLPRTRRVCSGIPDGSCVPWCRHLVRCRPFGVALAGACTAVRGRPALTLPHRSQSPSRTPSAAPSSQQNTRRSHAGRSPEQRPSRPSAPSSRAATPGTHGDPRFVTGSESTARDLDAVSVAHSATYLRLSTRRTAATTNTAGAAPARRNRSTLQSRYSTRTQLAPLAVPEPEADPRSSQLLQESALYAEAKEAEALQTVWLKAAPSRHAITPSAVPFLDLRPLHERLGRAPAAPARSKSMPGLHSPSNLTSSGGVPSKPSLSGAGGGSGAGAPPHDVQD